MTIERHDTSGAVVHTVEKTYPSNYFVQAFRGRHWRSADFLHRSKQHDHVRRRRRQLRATAHVPDRLADKRL